MPSGRSEKELMHAAIKKYDEIIKRARKNIVSNIEEQIAAALAKRDLENKIGAFSSQKMDRLEELEHQYGIDAKSLDKYATAFGLAMHYSTYRLLSLLMKREIVSVSSAFIVIYGDKNEADHPQDVGPAITHAVHRLNTHILKKLGVRIKNSFRVGYYIEPADKAKIEAFVATTQGK